MRTEKLNRYQAILEKMKGDEEKRAERIKDGLRTSMMDSIDELSFYDNHPADIGDETFEREKDLGFKLFTEDRLAMIEEALKNIEEGTYGICESCGREISQKRLQAVPYTSLCMECKKENEGLERHPRPIEEDVIQPPFGGNYLNEDNAFDGEDAWQAVARYGTSETPSDIGNSADDYDDIYINADEDIGIVEEYEGIPAEKKRDGQLYQDFGGKDDEDPPFNWANK